VKFFTNLADRQLGLERFPEITINLENCGESVADILKVSPRRFARQANSRRTIKRSVRATDRTSKPARTQV